MDKNMHKRSIFDVYSSEEEEISNVNKLQKDFESESTLSSSSIEDSNKKCAILGLEKGDTFEDWESAEKQVEIYSKVVGFGVVKRRLEKNSHEHNHPLYGNGNKNITLDHCLNPEMLKEIEFLVNISCRAGPIIRMLQKWFSDTTIHPKNVYNAICLFRRDQKLMKTDAAKTYDKLMKMQREDNGWNCALCFTHRSFNAGVQSTQRVENYNALIKKSVGRSTTLYELDTQIQLQLDKEEKFERLEEQINQNPRVVLKMQRRQMNESLLYHVKKIENWELLLEHEAYDFDEKTNKEQKQTKEKEQEQSDKKEWEQFDEERDQSDDEERDQSDDKEQEQGRFDNEGVEKSRMKQKDSKVKFAEDDYESKLSNLRSLILYLGHTVIQEHSRRTCNRNFSCSKKNVPDDDKLVYEHQIRVNFDILNEICHMQLFSETVKQNLSHKTKYNEGFSNPHQARTKGAPKKHVKNTLKNTTIKYNNNIKNRQDMMKLNVKAPNKQSRSELQPEIPIRQTKYICSYCKGNGHNARSCELKKKSVRARTK
ncbi:unnamed protein product [Rhizophagus irregularis]|nr:unnamed protein product [Rhizophagus irregularis]